MVTKVEAAIGPDKRIAHWTYEVWSNSHNTRAVKAGGYAVAQQVRPGFAPQEAKPIPMPEGDGDRNANPLYVFPNMNVLYHFVPEMPLRVSALRSLGAHLNVFTIEHARRSGPRGRRRPAGLPAGAYGRRTRAGGDDRGRRPFWLVASLPAGWAARLRHGLRALQEYRRLLRDRHGSRG
jgi:hypothetical protein